MCYRPFRVLQKVSVMNEYSTCAVILAAGSGTRMGAAVTKQKIELLGKSILRRTLEAFEAAESVRHIVVVARADELDFASSEAEGITKLSAVVAGGKCRAESARIGFLAAPGEDDIIAIHDGARCLIKPADIDKVVSYAYKFGAATAAVPVTDTLKRCDGNGVITATVSRENMYSALTPQVFSRALYRKAQEVCGELSADITDDNMLAERAGIPVRCVTVSGSNIKITAPSDIPLAEYLIGAENAGE